MKDTTAMIIMLAVGCAIALSPMVYITLELMP